ncbi:MAG TPA: phosphodiester glycosidase family protein [Gemmatimonadales bacterium]|nr:phosphodiester glycosidase family protein [Gemmatimonadales bacterium]
MPALPFPIDTTRTESIRPGVFYRYIYTLSGPWAIHVLQADLDRCNTAVAVKGPPGAVGREKTSAFLGALSRSRDVIGGVNADFFLFSPPGVPAGALVTRGRVVTGPSSQPVLAIDSAGRPAITVLRVTGTAAIGAARIEISNWNRSAPSGIAFFDPGWGARTDTGSSRIEVVLRGSDPARVDLVDTSAMGVDVPISGAVLMAGPGAPAATRAALLALRSGDTVRTKIALGPWHPLEAVGGRPALLRDSVVVPEVDTEGQPGFAAGRHPRTAVGVARGGRRLLLVVVDGRQRPHSDGMTLGELADLLLGLGASEAINLDGGGSSTLVYMDPAAAGSPRVANRPSDPAGERAVGNALAIVGGACAGPVR